MVLKENEMQFNKSGISIKTSKNNISRWMNNIKTHMESLDYKINEREINNGNGTQYVIEKDKIKFNFEFYKTGRIVIRTTNNEELAAEFLERHHDILGENLNVITSDTNNYKKKINESTTCKSIGLQSLDLKPMNTSTPLPSRESKKVDRLNKSMIELHGREIIVKNYEQEIITLKRELNEMTLIINQQNDRISKLETSNLNNSDVISIIKACNIDQRLSACNEINEIHLDEESHTKSFKIKNQLHEINEKINTLQSQRKIIDDDLKSCIQKTDEFTTTCVYLKNSLYGQELFSTANRERIISLETTVQSQGEAQQNEILPKIEQIDDIYKLCADINTYNQEELVKAKYLQPTPPSAFIDNLDNDHTISPNNTNSLINETFTSEKETLELLVIGSSIVKYIAAKKIEKRLPNNTLTECLPGAKVDDVMRRINELHNIYDIKKVVIHVGGNNIPRDNSTILTKKLIEMLQNTRRLMPKAKIYFSAIIPRVKNEWLPEINTVNGNLRTFCGQNLVQFIPHYQFYENSGNINFRLLCKDMVHPTREGTVVLARNIIAIYRNYVKFL